MKTSKHPFYLILLLGLALRLYFAFSSHYISPDGTQYARLGYHLWHDFAYVSSGSQFPDVVQPPLYPAVLGIFTLFLSPEAAGKTASVIFGLLLVWAVYAFTRRLSSNERVAGAAALFVALNPGLVAVSSQVASESLFLFLLFAAFSNLLGYFRDGSFKALGQSALFFGLAVLTRPEALLYFAAASFVLLLERVSWRHWLGFVLVVLLFWGSYSAWSSVRLGRFSYYPKLEFVRAQGALARHFAGEKENTPLKLTPLAREDRFRYALAPDQTELAVNALFLRKDRQILESGRQNHLPANVKLLRIAYHYGHNVRLVAGKFLKGWAFPWIYWLFFLAGLWKLPLRKYRREIRAAFLFLMPLGIIVFSGTEQRFLYFIPVLAAPLLGRGLLQWREIIGRNKNRSGSWIVPFLLLFLGMLPSYAEIGQKTQEKDYYFGAGQWLKHQVPAGRKVAATVPQAVFFADRPYCVLPFAPLDSLRKYLQIKGVHFVLIEESDRARRPNLNLNALPSFVEKENTAIINKHRFILLRVKKENAHERTHANH